jgi:hypothetical protein
MAQVSIDNAERSLTHSNSLTEALDEFHQVDQHVIEEAHKKSEEERMAMLEAEKKRLANISKMLEDEREAKKAAAEAAMNGDFSKGVSPTSALDTVLSNIDTGAEDLYIPQEFNELECNPLDESKQGVRKALEMLEPLAALAKTNTPPHCVPRPKQQDLRVVLGFENPAHGSNPIPEGSSTSLTEALDELEKLVRENIEEVYKCEEECAAQKEAKAAEVTKLEEAMAKVRLQIMKAQEMAQPHVQKLETQVRAAIDKSKPHLMNAHEKAQVHLQTTIAAVEPHVKNANEKAQASLQVAIETAKPHIKNIKNANEKVLKIQKKLKSTKTYQKSSTLQRVFEGPDPESIEAKKEDEKQSRRRTRRSWRRREKAWQQMKATILQPLELLRQRETRSQISNAIKSQVVAVAALCQK